MELLVLLMAFLGVDRDLFLELEDIFSEIHSFKSLTNFPGVLLLFKGLLDLFMDFLGIDLDLFFMLEDILFEELPLFMELLMAFFLMPAEADIF